MVERFLQWIWQNKLINEEIKTENGKNIKIISPGVLNLDEGPDFLHAVIEIDGNLLEGDVEVHFLSTHWKLHNHQNDHKYNNVILHIVIEDGFPVYTSLGKEIETIALSSWSKRPINELLKEYNKQIKVKKICPFKKKELIKILNYAGIERFNSRVKKFTNLINSYGKEQAIYIGIMEALGYVKNEHQFLTLSRLATIDKIRKITNGYKNKRKVIETILLSVAGLSTKSKLWSRIKPNFNEIMKKYEWQFFKVRPPAFPNKRIERISYFLNNVINDNLVNFLLKNDIKMIEKELSIVSKAYAKITILNVILPLLKIMGKNDVIKIYKNYKALPENNITKIMKRILKIRWKTKNEIHNQGLLHIFYNYCNLTDCPNCLIKATIKKHLG